MTLEGLAAFAGSHLTAIVALIMGVVFGVIPLVFLVRLFRAAGDEVAMLERGWRCEALILEVWATGARAGSSQFMGMRLEVHLPDGATYETKIEETIVPWLLLPELTAGTRVPVKVARENRELVGLDIGFITKVPPAA